MKTSKRVLAVFSAACIAASMSIPAFAAEIQETITERIAYMDTTQASQEMREEILNARRAIVYGSQAWSADGKGYIINADGSEEKLPLFSELFPGWDLKELSTVEPEGTGVVPCGAAPYFFDNIVLKTAPWPNASEPIYRFNSNGEKVYAGALTLPTGCKHFHVGITNMDTGEDVQWYGSLSLGQKGSWDLTDGVRYGVRISAEEPGISGIAYVGVSTNLDDFEVLG